MTSTNSKCSNSYTGSRKFCIRSPTCQLKVGIKKNHDNVGDECTSFSKKIIIMMNKEVLSSNNFLQEILEFIQESQKSKASHSKGIVLKCRTSLKQLGTQSYSIISTYKIGRSLLPSSLPANSSPHVSQSLVLCFDMQLGFLSSVTNFLQLCRVCPWLSF